MKPVQSCDVFSHHHHDKLEVWPSASTQFAMQGLKIAIQQQCTWGYTRGGVWPLKSQNITNPRRTFWYRPSSAPFYKKKKKGGGTNSSEITLSCVECAIKQGSRGSGCRSCACRRGWECCTESALRGPICSHFWAVLFAGFTDQSWIVFFFLFFLRWQLDRSAPSAERRDNYPISDSSLRWV